jgi:uncharacterized protein (DUF952 family)
MSETILHITTRDAWDVAQRQGQYSAPSLMSEGFIHCSTRKQVLPVADQFYKGQTGLIILVIDATRLSSKLKWEPPFEGASPAGVPANDAFPHIYGPINLEAVVQVLGFEPASDGRFVLPALP